MNAVAKMEPKSQDMAVQATPAYLLQMAVQQGADLDKLEKLMALQERWEANEARKAFTVAMTAFKSEPIEILKSKHVHFETTKGSTDYDHAELSDIADAMGAKLAAHGLSYRWNVMQKEGSVAVECILTHADGHNERVIMHAPPDATGGKNSIQQIASTVTYLQRYTLLAITGQATKGQDNDGAGGKDDPCADWLAAIEACAMPDALAKIKRELLEACGGKSDAVPEKLRAACTAKAAALQKAAKA